MKFRALLVVAPLLVFAACTDNAPAAGADTIKVVSTDDECRVGVATAPSGDLVFDVKNEGSEVTEFYLLDSKGKIVGEVENIGPGLSRQLVVTAPAGAYVTACKPGMVGDGIQSDFTVTDSGY